MNDIHVENKKNNKIIYNKKVNKSNYVITNGKYLSLYLVEGKN